MALDAGDIYAHADFLSIVAAEDNGVEGMYIYVNSIYVIALTALFIYKTKSLSRV